ncbi:MAG: cupin domain-containing protein [Synergistales bacterium]|nr:cupin domain-containing protein [Synergistales bacterium]
MIRHADELAAERRDDVRGGSGSGLYHVALAKEESPREGRFKMVAKIDLEPGASVGEHLHASDEEVYYILSGSGVFLEDGTEHALRPGDVTVTRSGGRHGIRAGDEGLSFLAVIAE